MSLLLPGRQLFSAPICFAIGLLSMAWIGLAAAETVEPAESGSRRVYLPMVMTGSKPNPSPVTVPAEIVGTWFEGGLLPLDFYDPTTGGWSSPSGMGQMYVFNADGSYTYT